LCSGELDDTKLIEGITGEKSIYKKRGEHEPEPGAPQEKPKRLRLLVDVSGSMYRFNGKLGIERFCVKDEGLIKIGCKLFPLERVTTYLE